MTAPQTIHAHPALDAPTLVRAAARLDRISSELRGGLYATPRPRAGRAGSVGACAEACEAGSRAIFHALVALACLGDHLEAVELIDDWEASKLAAGAGR